MKYYFETPAQVVFHDPDNPGSWLSGIGYHDEIICACCGGVFEVADVCKYSEGEVECPIYIYKTWVDLSEEIIGDELPFGLELKNGHIIEADKDSFGEIIDEETAEYESYYFKNLEDSSQATFANSWVDGIEMPNIAD